MQNVFPPNPVVSAEDLDHLGPVRILYVPAGDERPSGLTTVPIEDWISRAKESRSGFDDLDFWQHEIEKLGVGPDALTVVLDDGRMTEAARVWFILQYFGLPVVVLNGGRLALAEAPQQAPRSSAPPRLDPGAGKVGLRDREGLRGDLPDVQILDARTAAQFRGEDLKGNSRGGQLPGAAHVSHDELLDGTHLRPAAEIEQLLDAKGIDGSKPIVSHCNGGGRAALAALAAVVAGRENVHVYYLSFADWAADERCPVHRPE
jgi:thiosulfate/3-mercaptopyruvate sulfurtransferase